MPELWLEIKEAMNDFDGFDEYVKRRRARKWAIGDLVEDEDGNHGVVAIIWNDGDICTIEDDAAHPGPKVEE